MDFLMKPNAQCVVIGTTTFLINFLMCVLQSKYNCSIPCTKICELIQMSDVNGSFTSFICN